MYDSFSHLLKDLDISKLPYESPARALSRLHEQYSRTGSYDSRDLRIVLGDPVKGVSIPTQGNIEEMLERFLKRS
ncbi:MAG: hypothetical protein WC867_02985 [Candidatus Pacearchaeota archaeon]|jgi:hypothetical protein